jgi:hypothetical protein
MFSHLRRRIGVLTAVAVLAALVPTLTTVSPASAAPATTAITAATLDAAPGFLACPTSASIPSAGFTDTTDTAVDCIKYYGITSGTTATTYSPTDSVSRWQMALYITRLLDVANVTLGTGADQGFTDISGKSAEIQTAINQIKQLGITTGVTATTYAPDSNVSRQEMALFIERMLDNLAAGPGGISEVELVGGAATTYINSNCNAAAACTGKYNYTDIDSGSVTVEASNSIKELFTLGIHDGVSATTFNPVSDMTRAAMATFLTAALNHTNVRPEGLILQSTSYSSIGANTHTLSVSHRDSSFDPITGTAVDVFRWTPTGVEGDRAFATASGACEDAVATGSSITACTIDVSEPVTDLTGNLAPTANTTAVLSQANNVAGTDNYYAWTAAAATTFDNDLHSSGTSYDTIAVVANTAAVDTNCSVDVPTYAVSSGTHFANMKYGAVSTVTCQVTNNSSDTFYPVPQSAVLVVMNQTRVETTVNGVASGATIAASNTSVYTDATGLATFTITGPANPGYAGVDKHVDTVVITTAAADAGELPSTGNAGFMTDGGTTLTFGLEYLDVAAAGSSSTTTQTASSGAAASARVRSVTTTSRDQYGDTVASNVVTFTSVGTLHQGALCTLDNPTTCTLAAHGLAVGEDVTILDLGSFVGDDVGDGVAAANGSSYLVASVPSSSTFTLKDADDSDLLEGTAASVAATPMTFTTTSFASATRTTNSAGTATFSWTDGELTSSKDTVQGNPAAGTASSAVFYRLDTAADVTSNDLDGTLDDGETHMKLREFDSTGKDYILEKIVGAVALHAITTYIQFTYDDNDQFAVGGSSGALNGTASTQAAWVLRMSTICTSSCANAAPNDVVYVKGWDGLSTAIVRHTSDS